MAKTRKVLEFNNNDQAFPKIFMYKLNRLASYVNSKNSGYVWTEYDEDDNVVNSFAEGESGVNGDTTTQPVAQGVRSHAEGSQTLAMGDFSHAQGKNTRAIGLGSFSGGYNADTSACHIMAKGDGSLAFGYLNGASGNIDVNGRGSFAIGYSSASHGITVDGDASGSLGQNNTITGNNNIAIGLGLETTDTSTSECLLLGRYNETTTREDILVVGNGTSFSTKKDAFRIRKDGNIYAYNKVSAANGFFQTSDLKKKNIISKDIDLDKCYGLIEKCSTIIYTLKDDESSKQQIGLIAQEVKEFFPEIVTEDANGLLSLDYSKLTVIILRIMKDLIDRVSKLENK